MIKPFQVASIGGSLRLMQILRPSQVVWEIGVEAKCSEYSIDGYTILVDHILPVQDVTTSRDRGLPVQYKRGEEVVTVRLHQYSEIPRVAVLSEVSHESKVGSLPIVADILVYLGGVGVEDYVKTMKVIQTAQVKDLEHRLISTSPLAVLINGTEALPHLSSPAASLGYNHALIESRDCVYLGVAFRRKPIPVQEIEKTLEELKYEKPVVLLIDDCLLPIPRRRKAYHRKVELLDVLLQHPVKKVIFGHYPLPMSYEIGVGVKRYSLISTGSLNQDGLHGFRPPLIRTRKLKMRVLPQLQNGQAGNSCLILRGLQAHRVYRYQDPMSSIKSLYGYLIGNLL